MNKKGNFKKNNFGLVMVHYPDQVSGLQTLQRQ